MEKKITEQLARELDSALHSLQVARRTKFSLEKGGQLKHAEKWLVMHLARAGADSPMTPSQIADKLGITLAAVTHKINSLEEQGFITRSSSSDDRRLVYVNLSEKGRLMFDQMKKYYNKKINGMVEYLGAKDTKELIRLITKISGYMGSHSSE